jgi:hypothetical protein
MWWDNFNLNHAIGIQSIQKSTYYSRSWTAKAFHVPTSAHGLCLDVDPNIVANPWRELYNVVDPHPHLLDGHPLQRLFTMLQTFDKNPAKNKAAMCTVMKVNCVPPKPSFQNALPDWKEEMHLKREPMDGFFPAEMSGENISSNRGLAVLLKQQLEKQQNTKYRVLLTDMAVHNRVQKVRDHAVDRFGVWSLWFGGGWNKSLGSHTPSSKVVVWFCALKRTQCLRD